MALNVGNDTQWQHFCAAAAPELAGDSRFTTNPLRVQNRESLFTILNALFILRTVADWCDRLEKAQHAARAGERLLGCVCQ